MSNARAEVYQSARYSLPKPQRTNAYASGKMNSFPHPGSFDQRCRTVEPAAALAKLLLSSHLPQCGQRICGTPTLEKYPNKPSHTNGFRAAAKQPPASVPPPPTVNDAIAAATPSHTATHQAGLAFRAVGSSLISRFQSHVSEMSRAFDHSLAVHLVGFHPRPHPTSTCHSPFATEAEASTVVGGRTHEPPHQPP
jgi:hypothetical protein